MVYVVGGVVAGEEANDRVDVGPRVGLARVGARDPGDDIGLRVSLRRRQKAHRPPGHERIAVDDRYGVQQSLLERFRR